MWGNCFVRYSCFRPLDHVPCRGFGLSRKGLLIDVAATLCRCTAALPQLAADVPPAAIKNHQDVCLHKFANVPDMQDRKCGRHTEQASRHMPASARVSSRLPVAPALHIVQVRLGCLQAMDLDRHCAQRRQNPVYHKRYTETPSVITFVITLHNPSGTPRL